jgi:hypothetical protein
LSCGILYQFLPGNVIASFGDASVGPYDGNDDSLIGVVNNSGTTKTSLTLSGTGQFGLDIFGFDGDGICTFSFTGNGYCSSLPAGSYAGPNTSFSGISLDQRTGTINFLGGLADGATAFFSLEDRLDPSAPPPAAATPEPGTLLLFGTMLGGLGAALRRRMRATGQETASVRGWASPEA